MFRLGIIGMSPGNGHPYSWSALCNGYRKQYMDTSGFPVISDYLSAQTYPEDFIQDAVVSHIWTQDHALSSHIAKASNIETVVTDFRDMIGCVDGILLARDDASMRLHFLKSLLPSGLPIYVDKPLALTVHAAKEILALQSYPGQIFSCSALRFANELCLDQQGLNSIGGLLRIIGVTPKSWNTYSPHIIEPIRIFYPSFFDKVVSKQSCRSFDRVKLSGTCASGLEFEFCSMGGVNVPIHLVLVGEQASVKLVFSDSFHAFKSALRYFLDTSCVRIKGISTDDMLSTVSLIEAGNL